MAEAKVTAEALERDWENVGEDEASVRRVAPDRSKELHDALGLQMISIRLQRALIEDLKFIATAHGIGYQPLIRDILSRFAVHEKQKIVSDAIDRKRAELEQAKQKVEELELELQRQKVA